MLRHDQDDIVDWRIISQFHEARGTSHSLVEVYVCLESWRHEGPDICSGADAGPRREIGSC